VMTKVRVVIPSYFDMKSAHEISHELLDYLTGFQLSIIVIDESLGQDNIECDLNCPLKVLIPSQRLGQQRQLVNFFRSDSEIIKELGLLDSLVVVMDADGEDNPAHVLRLINELQENQTKVVVAKRLGRDASYKFKAGYFAFRVFSWILTGNWVATGSFSVADSDWLLKEIHNPVFSYSFAGGILSSNGDKAYVPLKRSARRYGKSRVNTHRLILHGLDFLLAQISQITARLFLLFSVGTAAGIIAIFSALVGKMQGWATEGWTTLVILGSLQISILLGVIFLISFVQYGFQNNQVSRAINYKLVKATSGI
jgi:hypothetical protein